MHDVHKITIQLRAPRGKDAGKIAIGHYMIVEGAVVLTDADGKPVGNVKHTLSPGEDARLVACRMLRRQNAKASGGDFSRPLRYPKIAY